MLPAAIRRTKRGDRTTATGLHRVSHPSPRRPRQPDLATRGTPPRQLLPLKCGPPSAGLQDTLSVGHATRGLGGAGRRALGRAHRWSRRRSLVDRAETSRRLGALSPRLRHTCDHTVRPGAQNRRGELGELGEMASSAHKGCSAACGSCEREPKPCGPKPPLPTPRSGRCCQLPQLPQLPLQERHGTLVGAGGAPVGSQRTNSV